MKKLALFIITAILIIFPIILLITTFSHYLGPGLSIWIHIGVYLHDLARFLAITGFVMLFIQFALSSRIKLIERDIGLDKLFRVHKIFGIIGFIFILIHPLALFLSDRLQGYDSKLFTPLKIIGIISLVLLALSALIAMLYGLIKIKYETWKNIHKLMYIAFPLAFIHSILIGSDLTRSIALKILWWVLLGAYLTILVYKLVMYFKIRRNPFKISEVKQETHDTWSLFFDGKYKIYKPGQFLTVRLIRNGKVSESHPFTMSSSPTRDKISITVKAVGDFTSTIKDVRISDLAYVDEPYGVFSFLNYDEKNLVFIAGGIGITPFISMLRYIYDKKLERNIVLIWGNKTSDDIAFKDELERLESEISSLKVIHVMSNQSEWQGEKGYIDSEKLKKYIKDFRNSQFFVCGPPIMMTKVIKALKELGVSNRKIHYERFALR
ncbi:MAG: ferredoxin reductase family protein [bacterium]